MLSTEPRWALADRATATFDLGALSDADAAVALPDGGVYVFSGDHVGRFDGVTGRLDAEYPAPISSVFPGAFPRQVDAAFLHPDGSLYLFRGHQHMRYNLAARRPEPGYPRSYAADWPGVFAERIDAALVWAPDTIYFFAEDAYTSFSPARRCTRPGYPKPIAPNWPGVGAGAVRAAVVLPGDRRTLVSENGIHVLDREGTLLEGLEGLEAERASRATTAAPSVTCETLALVRRCHIGRLQHGTAETYVLIPTFASAPALVDVFLHFHGFGAGYHVVTRGNPDFASVLQPGERRDIDLYHLDTQLDAVSRRNERLTIAVLPQGSTRSKFDGLSRTGAFLDDVVNALVAGGAWSQAPTIGNVVISGHSGGGPPARAAAERLKTGFSGGGPSGSAHFAGLALFDAVQGSLEVEAAQGWLRDAIRADVRALLSVSADAGVDTYVAGRPRFRGYTSPGGYPARYKSLTHAIESEVRLGRSRGLSDYAAAKLRELYQVLGPIGPRSVHNAYEAHEHLLGARYDPGKPGIVYEALEGLGSTTTSGNSATQPEAFFGAGMLEAETSSAPPPIPRGKEPRAVPPDKAIDFAPEPPPGSYWPLRTTDPEGRTVSYEAADGSQHGMHGRKFLAGRTTKHSDHVNRWHVGIDLFANPGDPVVACEQGEIVHFGSFTPATKSHGPTNQLLIAHAGCVINYGEVAPDSLRANGLEHAHAKVNAGQRIGSIGGTGMLHFETYRPGVAHNLQWLMNQPDPPVGLLNPTRYLLNLQELGLDGTSTPASSAPPATGASFTDSLKDALNAGQWSVALAVAIMSGRRDENTLTDMLFYARHRELADRRLGPGDRQLATEWTSIRDQLVRPALAQGSATSAPAGADRETPLELGPGLPRSRLFQNDADLKTVAEGRLRLGPTSGSQHAGSVRSSGAAVQKLQQALVQLGYALPSGADGRYGHETINAVLAYRRKFNIRTANGNIDGTVGPATLAHIDAALVTLTAPPPAPVVQPPATQPVGSSGVLDPTRWGPLVRAALSTKGSLTYGNAVLSLIDGPDTYRQMVADIRSATGPGHFIYLLGWAVLADFPLLAGDSSVTLWSLLRARPAQVQLRALGWDDRPNKANALPWWVPGPLNQFIAKKVYPNQNSLAIANINIMPGAAARLDNETLQFGSQHQKLLIVNGERGLVAFCGGVDFNPDRVQAGTSEDGATYHDVHCRVVGPAAWDLLQTFIRRWYHHPDHAQIDGRTEALRGAQLLPPPALQTPPSDATSVPGTCSVGVARTFVSRRLSTPSETDIRSLFLICIRNARRFIYIEDQYMVDLEGAVALRLALPRLEHVTILIAPSEQSDMPCIWTFRKNFIETATSGLLPADREKLRIFHLVSPPSVAGKPSLGPHTYVHAKTWCIDDEIAAIGSANLDRRGWETDAEVDAFIFDDQRPAPGALTFAQDLRCRLWAEHLGVSLASVQDGVASANLWLRRGANARVVPYDPVAGDDSNVRTAATVGGLLPVIGSLMPSKQGLCEMLRDVVDPGLSS